MDSPQERKNLFVGHSHVPADVNQRSHVPRLERQRGDAPALATPAKMVPAETGRCRALAPVLNRVGDKWSMLIVMNLSNGSRRFNELKRQIDGISQRMLTHSLRGLERDGLVSRAVTPSIPPRVDYTLTELGISLREPVKGLGDWAITHIDCIRAAQQAFDRAGEAA